MAAQVSNTFGDVARLPTDIPTEVQFAVLAHGRCVQALDSGPADSAACRSWPATRALLS